MYHQKLTKLFFRSVLSGLLVCVSTSTVTLNAQPFSWNCPLYDYYKISKMAKKIIDSKNKSIVDVIKSLKEFKKEYEKAFNVSVNLNIMIDNVMREFRGQGVNISDSLIKKIKDKITGKKKKALHRFDYPAYPRDDEIEVPGELVFGVVLCLLGLFIIVIPETIIAGSVVWGRSLIISGGTISGKSLVAIEEEKRRNRK